MLTRVCAAGALLFVLAVAALPAAEAHAVLVTSDPARNSRVDTAPAELRLTFSEEVEDQYTDVRVVDSDGVDRARSVDIQPGRTRIHVALDPLPDGVYVVHWQTLSRDTHTVRGQYLLAVNVSFDAATLPAAGAEIHVPQTPQQFFFHEVVVRGVGFLGAVLAAGIPLYLLLARPGGTLAPRSDPLLRAAGISAAVGALSGLALLGIVALRIDASLVATAATQSGRWIGARIVLLAGAGVALLAVATRAADRRSAGVVAAAAAGLFALGATTLASHSAGETSFRTAAILVDWLHQVAVAFWIGGVVSVLVLAHVRAEAIDLGAVVRRFSPWAIGAVIVIILTGTGLSLLRVVQLSDFGATYYGRALLLKILLLVPLVGLGALNRYWALPRFENKDPSDDRMARRGIRRSLLTETALMTVVLFAAATLATVAPPDSLYEAGEGPGVGADDFVGLVATFEAAGHTVTVRALPDPLRVGPQNVTVTLATGDGQQKEVRDVVLVLRSPEVGPDGEGELRTMQRIDDRTFRVSGFLMTEAGTWHNDIFLQGPDLFHEEHVPMFVQSA